MGEFNEAQVAAIKHKKGPMLVLAGAGSGKTTVLTYRIKNLIMNREVNPKNILVLTFTKAAAKEMEERFHGMMPKRNQVTFGTFHSVFLRILVKHGGYSYKNIVSPRVQTDIIQRAATELDHYLGSGFQECMDKTKEIILNIELIKNHRIKDVKEISEKELELKNMSADTAWQFYQYYQNYMQQKHMIDFTDMKSKDVNKMLSEMKNIDGISFALGMDTLVGSAIPQDVIPDSIKSMLKSDDWQLMLIGSEYKTASDEVNNQIQELNNIVKKYDKDGMLIGEAPATKDLIKIMDHDFNVVSAASIGVIFILIALVLKSISLPVILVAVIEFAIFVNMGIPAYTGTVLPFIASIVIGTIQLGATVDYAILMTTRYKKERSRGKDKKEAVYIALSTSMKSIIVSALGFFAATIGVGLYSKMDMISSLCILMSRGAIISMFTVILVLPSMFMLFDKLICKTSMGFKPKKS